MSSSNMALKAMFDSMGKIALVTFPGFVSFMSVQDMLTNTSEKLKKNSRINLSVNKCFHMGPPKLKQYTKSTQKKFRDFKLWMS